MVLRERESITRGWRTLYYGELYDLYPSTNIIYTTTSRQIRWAKHVAREGGCIQNCGEERLRNSIIWKT